MAARFSVRILTCEVFYVSAKSGPLMLTHSTQHFYTVSRVPGALTAPLILHTANVKQRGRHRLYGSAAASSAELVALQSWLPRTV